MNIGEIKVGDVFKNYKELCKALNIEPSTGRGRNTHFEKIAELMELEKKGHSYTVRVILKNEIVDKRNKRNSSNHIAYMKLLLLHILKEHGDEIQYFSKTSLAITLQLINDEYTRLFKGSKKAIANTIGIQEDYITDFMDSSSPAYKNAIKTILKQLHDDGAVFVDNVTMITYRDFDGALERSVPASAKEKKEILKIQKECRRKLGGTNLQSIYKLSLADKYYSMLKEELKSKMNITYCYRAYEIQGLEESLNDEYNYLLLEEGIDSTEIDNMRLYLQQKIYDEWHKSSMRRFSRRKINAKGKSTFGEVKDVYKVRVSDDYEREMENLYNIFIRNKEIVNS